MEVKKVALYAYTAVKNPSPYSSVEGQLEVLNRHCVEQGWKVVETFQETGKFRNGERPLLVKLLSKADEKSNSFNVLLVQDISRLSRNTGDAVTIRKALHEKGIELVFLETERNASSMSVPAILLQ